MKYELRIMVFVLSMILASLFISQPVFAQTPPPCVDADSIAKGFGPCPAGLNEIEQMVGNVISVIVGLGFIAMLVLLIFAGIKYLTSGGDPKALQSAHLTVTWALLGIFFLALTWLILQLIAAFTGIETLTIFNIKALCKIGNNNFCP